MRHAAIVAASLAANVNPAVNSTVAANANAAGFSYNSAVAESSTRSGY